MPTLTLEFVKQLYAHADSAHAFDHVMRVTRLAVHIAEAEGADVDVVRVAALLHDMADAREAHHLEGARQARSLLIGSRPEFIDAVAHCIEAHRFSQPPEPKTLEARCLNDADKLDAIGAIGIARAFAFAGAHGNRLWSHPLDEIESRIGENREAYRRLHGGAKDYTPSHEFICKLERLAETMYTATAREIARERHAFMWAFFQRLDEEAIGAR